MTSTQLATTLNCTPQYVRLATKKAKDNGQNTICIKGETYSFVEVVAVASRGKAYCYTELSKAQPKKALYSTTVSANIIAELEDFPLLAKSHTTQEKVLMITFYQAHNYGLKAIIKALSTYQNIYLEEKEVASLERKIRRWNKEFKEHGKKALADKRGAKTGFRKVDEELLIQAIMGAGKRGIRENYYGVHRFYCHQWQMKEYGHVNTTLDINTIVSYNGLTKAIKTVFEKHHQVKMFWKKGKDGLLQDYVGGIKDILYTNQEWQVDATKFDFMCKLIAEDGSVKIGRFNLTAVIDVFTGNAVATLTESIDSYAQVRVLHKAFERMGKPEQIYTDNGMDYVSNHYEGVLENIGITQIHAQVGQGRQKGKIERFFGVVQTKLAHLPGYIGNNVEKRTHIEDQTASKIDIRTSKATRINEARLLTFDELQTIVDNTLAKASQSYAEHTQQLLSAEELEEIRRKSGKSELRKVQKDGIRLNNYTYTSVSLWEGGLNQGNMVEVYEDIDNINVVYVYHKERFIGQAFNRELGVEAMSLEEHKRAKKAHKANYITPALKNIRSSAELYAQYQDFHAEELLNFTPEYAQPKPKEEKKEEIINNDYLDLVKQLQA